MLKSKQKPKIRRWLRISLGVALVLFGMHSAKNNAVRIINRGLNLLYDQKGYFDTDGFRATKLSDIFRDPYGELVIQYKDPYKTPQDRLLKFSSPRARSIALLFDSKPLPLQPPKKNPSRLSSWPEPSVEPSSPTPQPLLSTPQRALPLVETSPTEKQVFPSPPQEPASSFTERVQKIRQKIHNERLENAKKFRGSNFPYAIHR